MGTMRMKKRQSRACWVKMTNLAGWWAQSLKRYGGAWRGFGRSRWILTNWHNLDGSTQLTTSVKGMRSRAHLIWGYWQSSNRTWMMMQPNLHQYHLESLCSDLAYSWNFPNPTRDFPTRKYSYLAKFWEAAVKHEYIRSSAQRHAQFITHSECEASWIRKLSTLHRASPADYHIEIGFRWRHVDGSCVIEVLQRQICIFEVISLWKAICVPILLHVSIFLIPGTQLWDRMICLCMCKGRTHYSKDVESKSGCKIDNKFDFCLPITVKWESKSYISDDIYWQIFSESCHMSHSKRC